MAACVFCDDAWPYREAIYEDEQWSLRGLDGPAGWSVLWLRRHAESITELTATEQQSLGPLVARISAAIEEAAGAERVYVNVYGDTHRHFHVVLLARGPDVPPDLRGPAMLPNASRLARDDERAERVRDQIQSMLAGAPA
jgi:diadenosine tetraphosphate (Ap4A) HIT family hydrolase